MYTETNRNSARGDDMPYDTLLFETANKIATVTINQPLNSFNRRMMDEFSKI